MVNEQWSGIRKRMLGCWLGQMAGDALGSQVEFRSAASLRSQWPEGLRDIGPSPIWRTAAGQVTDDSEMAIELLHALSASPEKPDWDRVAANYIRWLQSHPFDIGGTVHGALAGAISALEGEGDLAARMRRSANPESKANGALMRQSPLAVWGYGYEPHIIGRLAAEDARLTHPNPVCLEASAVYVATMAHAIRWGCDAETAYKFALDYHQRFGQEPDVFDALVKAASDAPPYSHHIGYVLLALHNAFYQLLHTERFEDAVVEAVMIGGDTDTNAAIAGALAGAVYGADAVPERWEHTLQTCGDHDDVHRQARYLPKNAYAEVLQLASRLQVLFKPDPSASAEGR